MKFELKHDQKELDFIVHNAQTFHPEYHRITLNEIANIDKTYKNV